MNPTQLTGEIGTFLSWLVAWGAIEIPRVVGAIALLIGGWWLANRSGRALRAVLGGRVDPMLTGVIAATARYGILIVILIAVLGQLGIETTSILAALGAAGLAIGLAMQGTLSNIAAGMMLLWLRPFKVGDYIDTGSFAGTVKDLGLFASELHSWDGIYQFIPNSQLWNTRIINYSRLPTRLVDLRFGVAYEDDIARGQQVLLALISGDSRVRTDPAPTTFVNALGDSSVELALRFWAASSDYWTLRWEMTERGKQALEAAGLSIPFPQRDLHIRAVPQGGTTQLASS